MAIRILAFIGAMICLILIFCPSAYAEAIDEDKVLEALSDVSEQVSQGSESSIADGLFGDADDMAQATLDMLSPKNALSSWHDLHTPQPRGTHPHPQWLGL